MSTLLEWTAAAHSIADAIDDSEQFEAAIEAFLTGNADLQSKLDAYCGLISELRARAEARKAEADRLNRLARTDSHAAARMTERLLMFLDAVGRDRVQTPHYRVSVVANGGKMPLVIECSPEALPEQYRVVTVMPNVEALREALDAGEEIEGVRFGERGKHVVIR